MRVRRHLLLTRLHIVIRLPSRLKGSRCTHGFALEIEADAIDCRDFDRATFLKSLTGISALHLAKRDGNDLVYAGKVGTGWSRTMSSEIRKKLDMVVSGESNLTKPIRDPKTT